MNERNNRLGFGADLLRGLRYAKTKETKVSG